MSYTETLRLDMHGPCARSSITEEIVSLDTKRGISFIGCLSGVKSQTSRFAPGWWTAHPLQHVAAMRFDICENHVSLKQNLQKVAPGQSETAGCWARTSPSEMIQNSWKRLSRTTAGSFNSFRASFHKTSVILHKRLDKSSLPFATATQTEVWQTVGSILFPHKLFFIFIFFNSSLKNPNAVHGQQAIQTDNYLFRWWKILELKKRKLFL